MIEFTEEAKVRALEILDEQGRGETTGLRIRIVKEGCTLKYEMDWEDVMQPGDRIMVKNQLIVYMDAFTCDALQNAIVDYYYQGDQEGFVILNLRSACSTCSDSAAGSCH
jgi:iron-sulfur cluster assembly accessory protein